MIKLPKITGEHMMYLDMFIIGFGYICMFVWFIYLIFSL